jgi:Putative F0F1-ATPase subunit Ca2+/Mg2+ transporter
MGEQDRNQERTLLHRALYGGFGDALSQAFEFAVIPVLFALAGLGLDAWLGTAPVFVVALASLGLVGVCLRTIYTYKARVEAEEEGKPWTRRQR